MTPLSKDEIIAWAMQSGLDQEFWLAESHPNFDNEMRMLTAFAHLCRADLVAEIETLRYEVDAVAEIKQERDALKADAELGRVAMRFVDRAGDVHPGIDDAETICADFYKAMVAAIDMKRGEA